MKIWTIIFLQVLILTAPGLPETITLEEAERLLVKDNRDISEARLELERAALALKERKSTLYPALSATAQQTFISEKNRITIPIGPGIDTTIGDRSRTELGIDVTWPIFTGLARKHSIDGARALIDSKKDNLKVIENEKRLQLALLYYRWDFGSKRIAAQQALLNWYQKMKAVTQRQVTEGVAVQTKLLQVDARLKLQEVEKLVLRDQCDSLKDEILFLIGKYGTETTLQPLPATIDTTSRQRFSDIDRAALRRTEDRVKQLEASQKATKASYLPKIVAAAGYRYGKPGLAMGGEEFMGYGTIGGFIQWDIFDGFAARHKGQSLEVQKEIVVQKREFVRESLKKTFTQTQLQKKQARKKLRAAQEALAAARKYAAAIKTAVDAGTAIPLDHYEALESVATATLAVEQAKFIYRVSHIHSAYAGSDSFSLTVD